MRQGLSECLNASLHIICRTTLGVSTCLPPFIQKGRQAKRCESIGPTSQSKQMGEPEREFESMHSKSKATPSETIASLEELTSVCLPVSLSISSCLPSFLCLSHSQGWSPSSLPCTYAHTFLPPGILISFLLLLTTLSQNLSKSVQKNQLKSSHRRTRIATKVFQAACFCTKH